VIDTTPTTHPLTCTSLHTQVDVEAESRLLDSMAAGGAGGYRGGGGGYGGRRGKVCVRACVLMRPLPSAAAANLFPVAVLVAGPCRFHIRHWLLSLLLVKRA
jgi:hypothetical protein